jgi:hypothetical protein
VLHRHSGRVRIRGEDIGDVARARQSPPPVDERDDVEAERSRQAGDAVAEEPVVDDDQLVAGARSS